VLLMAELRNDIVGKFRTRLKQAIATLDRNGMASE
jgi:hypothetical protein